MSTIDDAELTNWTLVEWLRSKPQVMDYGRLLRAADLVESGDEIIGKQRQEIARLQDQLATARKALEWYADYTIVEHHPDHKEFDMGYRARTALAQIATIPTSDRERCKNGCDFDYDPYQDFCMKCGAPRYDAEVTHSRERLLEEARASERKAAFLLMHVIKDDDGHGIDDMTLIEETEEWLKQFKERAKLGGSNQ
jgi:hypothetical protein